MATFEPIEPIPEVGAKPIGSLFFRRTHRPHLFCAFSRERGETLAEDCYKCVSVLKLLTD